MNDQHLITSTKTLPSLYVAELKCLVYSNSSGFNWQLIACLLIQFADDTTLTGPDNTTLTGPDNTTLTGPGNTTLTGPGNTTLTGPESASYKLCYLLLLSLVLSPPHPSSLLTLSTSFWPLSRVWMLWCITAQKRF